MKVAVVTGATGGIGERIAAGLVKKGYVVYSLARSRKNAEGVRYRLVDLSDFEAAGEAVRQIAEEAGRIDLLVNNAGISLQKQVQDTTDADWQKVVNVNLGAAFYVTKAALPAMIARKSGKIVNISSMWGLTGASCEAAYSAAKAGLIGWTKALAKEVGPSGIHVNCVAPGLIDTEMNANLSDADRRAIIDETPLCRIGTPQDVADAVLFFASPQASFITGEVLRVDGGLTV